MLGLGFEVSALRAGRKGKGIPTTNFTPKSVAYNRGYMGFYLHCNLAWFCMDLQVEELQVTVQSEL